MGEEFKKWWLTHYDHHINNMPDMSDAFEAGRKSEREACAKLAENITPKQIAYDSHPEEVGDGIAKLIRARGNNGD